MPRGRKRILLIAGHVVALYATRKELIKKLVDDGHEVYASCPRFTDVPLVELGCTVVETPVERRGLNPIQDLKLLVHYILLMRNVRPDVILSFNIKPNIYGGLAARVLRVGQVANITGTGEVFMRSRVVAATARILYRLSLHAARTVFFQNPHDAALFSGKKLIRGRSRILPGSGVNLDEFSFAPPARWRDEPVFILLARAKKMKGVLEFIRAAELVKAHHPGVRFLLAGPIEEPDLEAKIRQANRVGIIEYLGFVRNVKRVLMEADCIVLPSIGGEGVPNVLLEAAATGRVCVATAVPGSVDVIVDGETGILCKAGHAESLVRALRSVVAMSQHEKTAMVSAARLRVEECFDRRIVIDAYLSELDW